MDWSSSQHHYACKWVKGNIKPCMINMPMSWAYKANPDAAIMLCVRKPWLTEFIMENVAQEELEYYCLTSQEKVVKRLAGVEFS